MSTPAGWYPNGEQWETYWDGATWTDQHRPRGTMPPPPPPAAAAPVQAATTTAVSESAVVSDAAAEPLLKFTSHVDGKNATISIYPDRVEWIKPRGVSGAKVTAGVLTAGLSVFATGVKNGKTGTEMIPIKAISSVTTKRDGMMNSLVSVITTGNTVDFRVSHKEAEQVKSVLTRLILAG